MARIDVLDHGYLELVETWGSDESIISSARMSTGKGFLGWGGTCRRCHQERRPVSENGPSGCDDGAVIRNEHDFADVGDEKLLKYLWENKHATPFEMAGLVIEVQAPIFVFREWHRHRTQSYNEMSARYVPLPDLNYVPTVDRLMANSKTNKQAGTIAGAAELTEDMALGYQKALVSIYQDQENLYQMALQWGVPKELARAHLPVGRYSRMRASANLRNWLAFLTLRMAPAAQWEIRQYANAVGELIAAKFPRTWELFKAGGSK